MSTNGLPFFNDVGSNYKFSDKLMRPVVNRSGFDVSYKNDLSAEMGKLIPVYFSYYYPSDSISLSIDNLIRLINPPVVPITSRLYVYFHFFKVDYSQLWQYWATMASKGYSGKFEATLPTIRCKILVDGEINPYLVRGSLADYLGFNLYSYDKLDYTADDYIDLPALPFLAYQMIYRNYYLNFNVASAYGQANPDSEYSAFFPDNEYDLMLKNSFPSNLTMDGSSYNVLEPLSKIHLGKLRYRDFATDYFTSALPWPMRGDAPTIGADTVLNTTVPVNIPALADTFSSIGIKGMFSAINYSSDNQPQTGVELVGDVDRNTVLPNGDFWNEVFNPTLNVVDDSSHSKVRGFMHTRTSHPARTGTATLTNIPVNLSVTQSQLKLLWTNTLIMEKLARTDGTYGQFVETFFGVRPSHYYSHKPTYLGGIYQPVIIEQVLQTSPADTGTLGTQGATGISSNYGNVGSFNSDDFGVCMCLMSIMTETYYSQGWMKEHLYRTQDDFPLPERANLGVQPITLEELYRYPDNRADVKKLFGYQSRFDELRYRQNEVHGAVADPTNLSFYPFTQSRDLQSEPVLNPSFLTTEGNLRKDWLTAPDEIPFVCQIVNRVNSTRPYPYVAPPSALMM